MRLNPDYFDILKAFNAAGVSYLIVGAYAFGFHVEPRTTKDIDIWVDPTPENAERVYQALTAFGAPLEGIQTQDFCNPDVVYQIGVAPNRIDILTGLESISFEEAWQNRQEASYGGEKIHIIGREDLIKVKRAAGRPQDLEDVRSLEAIRKLAAKK